MGAPIKRVGFQTLLICVDKNKMAVPALKKKGFIPKSASVIFVTLIMMSRRVIWSISILSASVNRLKNRNTALRISKNSKN